MNERLKTHSKTQKKSADLVSNKLRIGVFQRYQMKCKSVSKKSPRYILKPGMSVEHVISIANSSGGLSGLKHAENLPVMDSYSVFMKEVNNRTKTIVMSERFPEKQKKVLSLLLAGHSWEYSAQFLKTGIRQIWLAEQSLKKRWGIPDSMSLREALLLSSNKFHGDGNALEKTNAMTLRENGNTNRYSVVVNAGTQVLSLHKYK